MFNQSGYNRIKEMEIQVDVWLNEAERLTDNTAAWMSGAQTYANSVERLLKGESNSYLAKANEIKEKDVERSVVYHRQHNLIERLLTDLKTLKP